MHAIIGPINIDHFPISLTLLVFFVLLLNTAAYPREDVFENIKTEALGVSTEDRTTTERLEESGREAETDTGHSWNRSCGNRRASIMANLQTGELNLMMIEAG